MPQLPTMTVVTLRQLGQHRRSANHACIIVGMHIDKARSQRQSLSVHLYRRTKIKTRSYRTNPPVRKGNIEDFRGRAATVQNVSIPY